MVNTTNKYLISALLLGIAFHGSSIFFTLESTYDALIHLFFGNHYPENWFEPWNFKWYTGFTVMSYPPLVHQSIALLSYIGGLKFGLYTVALTAVVLFITGVYRFSLLMTSNRNIAGYAALLCVFSSSFVETLHLFGQLPSIIGISVLLHALPEIYLWLYNGKWRYLITSLSLIAVTVTSHHVTPIFGMVFFIFPLIGMVIMDRAKDDQKDSDKVTFRLFLRAFFKLFKRIVGFGLLSLVLIITCILPYWINTKNNPITQVPIPHGSRDNFIEITSSGLVFFLIPWGILLILLPYIFYRYYSRRFLFFGFSFSLLTLLGTGGTTPIPRLMLGENAFNILTLDRFTLWASIMALPMLGEFTYRFVQGDLKQILQNRFGPVFHRISGGLLAGLFLFMTIFTMSLGYFRPAQPKKIEMLPIVNFLNQDEHYKWRYLTLGFGDQMAWLSAQTNALTVDGNYHSARRLPELTTRAIERLENSKFKGIEGIGSLQQFLTVPEKYNLKYIFANDKFYDPILFYCGWQRLQRLENGIQVWEKINVPPLSKILPRDQFPRYQSVIWGIIPFATVILAFILNIQMIFIRLLKLPAIKRPDYFRHDLKLTRFPKTLVNISHAWFIALMVMTSWGIWQLYIRYDAHQSPENAILAYYDALDFKEFEKAHKLLDPESGKSLDQFMLEMSVGDGLLSSYAKLDSITTTIKSINDSAAIVSVNGSWISPLEQIHRSEIKTVIKRKNKWFLVPEKQDLDLPPDQLMAGNLTKYYNHGRRRVTTEQSHHEDILRQPLVEILSARLVKFNDSYAVIGEIQNIDNVPADVIIKSTLYNSENESLASYNSKFHMKHKLLPKEITAFRIDFEGIAWQSLDESVPRTYDPDRFTPVELSDLPEKFDLHCESNVSGKELYNEVGIYEMNLNNQSISGTLVNFGLSQVTISQLLVSYYNDSDEIVWVDHHFIDEGIRQQRKQNFDIELKNLDGLKVILSDLSTSYINGEQNSEIESKTRERRIPIDDLKLLKPVNRTDFSYIKLQTNNYIGNPK
ncbi:MAG: hypothetical protein KJN68_02625 [Bacteroidia bacterium]|nr:hypothetical protein [Bacteroidia bacterium]